MKIRRLDPIAVAMPLSKPIKMAGVEIGTADNVLVRLETGHLLMEMQGGRIWFESEPGQGSSFHVTFPSAEETGVRKASTPQSPQA